MNSSPAPADPKSWAFWRKRLGRALVVAALALTAAQILPALPREQRVFLHPPGGDRLTVANLTYSSKEDGEALSGTRLLPAEPARKLTHTASLPDDEYLLSVDAIGVGKADKRTRYILSKTVVLSSGHPAHVYLKPSKPPN